MGCNSKKEWLVIEPKSEKWQKEKDQREGRTYRSSVGRKRIAHNIRITEHNMLPSKAIKAISIDRPRKVWRVIELTDSKLLLLQFSTLEIITNKVKERDEKKKILSIYLSSKGSHEVGDVEILIVQPLKKLPDIGNTIPP